MTGVVECPSNVPSIVQPEQDVIMVGEFFYFTFFKENINFLVSKVYLLFINIKCMKLK